MAKHHYIKKLLLYYNTVARLLELQPKYHKKFVFAWITLMNLSTLLSSDIVSIWETNFALWILNSWQAKQSGFYYFFTWYSYVCQPWAWPSQGLLCYYWW